MLQGGDENDEDGVELDVQKWCSTTVYEDFSDGPEGFYKVYADVFAGLEKLEDQGRHVYDSSLFLYRVLLGSEVAIKYTQFIHL